MGSDYRLRVSPMFVELRRNSKCEPQKHAHTTGFIVLQYGGFGDITVGFDLDGGY